MTDGDRLQFLEGRLSALMAFAFAAISSHPEPEKLRAEFERLEEIARSQAEAREEPEAFLSGHAETAELLSAYLSRD